ncbi:MAG: SusD/RagB family nutrient-binding outer membrane lipoprotein [Muribaculaceae bacterium]|nr:SusD/RagB family nutrient-binding outer membrane lipoprotein [Muribaculaceae bacterium]
MKFFKVLLIAGVAALSLTSCNDWLDVNNDPNTPTSADASLNARCVYMQHYSIAAYMIPSSNTAYYCGQLATYTGGQQTAAMNWNLGGSNRANNAQQWFLVPVGGNLPDLYNQAMEQGAYHYAAMACYFKAFGFMNLADLFGECPFDEALGDATNPKYNTGKEVFMGCIDLIDEAIELFQKAQDPAVTPLSAGDMWNGGDTQKWVKLCYMLKARWLNHLSKKANGSYKDGKYDQTEILACLDKAMKSNADNTVVMHEDNNSSTLDHEGWQEPVDYSALYSCIGMNNNRMFVSKCFYDNLTNFDGKGIEDPRADKFIPWCRSTWSEETPSEVKWSEDGLWRRSLGVDLNSNIISNGGPYPSLFNKDTQGWYCDTKNTERLGDTIYVQGQSGSTGYGGGKDMLMRKSAGQDGSALSGVFWTRPTSPTVVGSYAECCFIKAEVLFNQGKKAEAFAAYKAGIKAHIDYVNDICKMWVAGDASLTDIPSFTPMKQADIDNYLNNAIGTAGDLTLAKIMTQKQFAVFFTTEMWLDMRRYDYDPSVFMGWHKPFMYENTASYWTYCPQGKYPRRWNQASYEKDYNSANLTDIASQIPGALDLPVGANGKWYLSDQICTLPVWWDSTQE